MAIAGSTVATAFGLCASLLASGLDAPPAGATAGHSSVQSARAAQIVLPPIDVPPIDLPGLPPVDLPPIVVPGLPPIDVPPIEVPGVGPIDVPPIAPTPPTTAPAGTATATTAAGTTAAGTTAAGTMPDAVVPIARSALAAVVAGARASIVALVETGVSPQLIASLQSLVDRVVDSASAVTAATIRELDALIATLRASLSAALQPLLTPIVHLIDELLGSIVDGVVVAPPVVPSIPDPDRNTGTSRSGTTGSSTSESRSDDVRDASDGSSRRGGTDPYDPVPVGSDTALFGASLLLPAPLPTPVRDNTLLAIFGATGGATSNGSDQTNEKAVLPGDPSAASPKEARAPPSSSRTIRTLGCGPESRPG
ncbi:MAG: hypothetical protein ABWY77_03725 [Acidimicrobiia bacterium]